jgi:hypothetical protein
VHRGGDGGGSIRIPAGYTGLFGMKGTYGRISRGPAAYSRPAPKCSAASPARCATRPALRRCRRHSTPRPHQPPVVKGTWEADLGSHDLKGLRVAFLPNLGGVELEPGVEDRLRAHADDLIAATGMVQVDIGRAAPNLAAEWMMGNVSTLLAELGDAGPTAPSDLTDEIEDGLRLSQSFYNLRMAAARPRPSGLELSRGVGSAVRRGRSGRSPATNPGPAFPAEQQMSSPPRQGDRHGDDPPRLGAVIGARSQRPVAIGAGFAPNLPKNLAERDDEAHPRPGQHGWAHDRVERLRQPGGIDPRRDLWTGCPWDCRCWAATTRTRSCSTWRWPPSASCRGRWWPRRSRPPRSDQVGVPPVRWGPRHGTIGSERRPPPGSTLVSIDVDHFTETGWLLTRTLDDAGVAELQRGWVDEVAAWPDDGDGWMHHRELTDGRPEAVPQREPHPVPPGLRACS